MCKHYEKVLKSNGWLSKSNDWVELFNMFYILIILIITIKISQYVYDNLILVLQELSDFI